jgi:hypothetical protein
LREEWEGMLRAGRMSVEKRQDRHFYGGGGSLSYILDSNAGFCGLASSYRRLPGTGTLVPSLAGFGNQLEESNGSEICTSRESTYRPVQYWCSRLPGRALLQWSRLRLISSITASKHPSLKTSKDLMFHHEKEPIVERLIQFCSDCCSLYHIIMDQLSCLLLSCWGIGSLIIISVTLFAFSLASYRSLSFCHFITPT